jgi:hypothetical protein
MKMYGITSLAVGLVVSLTFAACTPVEGTGPDRNTRSDVTTVTWTDNRTAYQVKCDLPGGCGERINTICKHGPHTTLKSENMPGPGNRRDAQLPATVVFRCG